MPSTRFIAPCAGDGRLIGYLQEHGHVCEAAMDIHPLDPCIAQMDALEWQSPYRYADFYVIENPPWTRELLHQLIIHCSDQHPTWFLFDLNWLGQLHEKDPLNGRCHLRCRKVVVVGQVKWFEGTNQRSFDHAAWYLFTRDEEYGEPRVYRRRPHRAK